MIRAVNKIRRKEPPLSSKIQAHTTLRWKCQIVLEYLKHRAEGRGQRDWGLYGHEARVE